MAIATEAVIRMWKRGRVSPKRQVTIPQKLFEQAGIKEEVEFGIKGNHIIIRPVREHVGNDYFADLILADLIQDGFTGEQLLNKFREKQNEFHTAIKNLLAESVETARNFRRAGNDETEELFGDVMED